MVTLDEIIDHKKKEVMKKKLKLIQPVIAIRQLTEKQSRRDLWSQTHGIATSPAAPDPRNDKRSFLSFTHALLNPKHNEIAIIGEVKLASPTEGILGDKASIPSRVRAYSNAGMDAISVVVDRKFFHGDPSFIHEIKQHVDLPVLAKDFIIDSYQIHELVNAGTDAVLLIAKILDEEKLFAFVEILTNFGIEPIVEVQNEEELQKALKVQAKIIAVNARNLSDFQVDIETACTLMRKIPNDRIPLGFSGIQSKQDILSSKEAGAQGVLIGTSLMKTDNIEAFIDSLV